MSSQPAGALHRRSLCLDAAAPLVTPRTLERCVPELRAGGLDAVLATVASIERDVVALAELGRWHSVVRETAQAVRLATTARDIREAAGSGELAVVLHFQGANPLGGDVDLLDAFYGLGVRVVQLTYNMRNLLGDGTFEPSDAGLSTFGRSAVRRMGALGIVVDVSHTGVRTSLEAIEATGAPVVATHANARAVCDHPRNLTDEQIRAVAASGGVVGLCAFPAFVSADTEPDLQRLLDHADHISGLVGAEHVGLGLDFADEDEDDFVFYGYDERYYPRPPWVYPEGIRGFSEFPNITEALVARGYSEEDVLGILGRNFLRAFQAVWGE